MLAPVIVKVGMTVLPGFLSRVAILTAWELAKETKGPFDDQVVKAAAQVLGVKLPERKVKTKRPS